MQSIRRKLPGPNALFVFEAAARCGNFTKAAEELHVTQPAVSRALTRLEEHLEVQLFDRVPGGIALTEDGEILYRRVAEAFRSLHAAFQEIDMRKSRSETVSLSVSTAFTTHWLMPRMHELHRDFPSVDLRFQLIPGHIGGPVEDVDLGMRFVSGGDLEHSATLVLPELLMPVCSPAYLETLQNNASEDSTLISLSGSATDWFSYFPQLNEKQRDPANYLVLSDYAVVLQAAMLGQGIAVGWLNVISNWLGNGALVPAEQNVVMTGRLCHLVQSRKNPSRSAVLEIRDWIIEKTRADLAKVDHMYPQLGLARMAQEASIAL